MNITYKHSARILMSLALVNGSLCFQAACRGAEGAPTNQAERTGTSGGQDLGLLAIDHARSFSSNVLAEATTSGLMVMSISKVISRTNAFFAESRQNLALEAAEPQLVDFLQNLAASNSALRVQSLSLHQTPDRSRLRASMTIKGDYRVPAARQSQEPAAAQIEQLVLSQRRHLRRAALDCYNLTKSALPPGWKLDSLNFQDGKRLSVHGEAPADQVRLLEDVKARFEKAQDGNALFIPSSGQATMAMSPATNFSWSIQFDLSSPEPN